MLDRINSSMPLKHSLIKWAGTLSNVKAGYGFSRASETLKHKTTVNTKGKRGGQWYIHKHHGQSEVFLKMLRLRKQGQHSPKMANAPGVRGSASVLVHRSVRLYRRGGAGETESIVLCVKTPSHIFPSYLSLDARRIVQYLVLQFNFTKLVWFCLWP